MFREHRLEKLWQSQIQKMVPGKISPQNIMQADTEKKTLHKVTISNSVFVFRKGIAQNISSCKMNSCVDSGHKKLSRTENFPFHLMVCR